MAAAPFRAYRPLRTLIASLRGPAAHEREYLRRMASKLDYQRVRRISARCLVMALALGWATYRADLRSLWLILGGVFLLSSLIGLTVSFTETARRLEPNSSHLDQPDAVLARNRRIVQIVQADFSGAWLYAWRRLVV